MFKQIILPILITIAIITVLGLYTKNPAALSFLFSNTPAPIATLEKKEISINNQKIMVEVAKSTPDREKGLGDRKSLEKDSGMLFIFDTKKVRPVFWMKGMLMPIDIIWIADSMVIKIDKNAPAPTAGTSDAQLTKYSTGKPVDYVLEVEAGYSDTKNIKVGNKVDLSKI